MGVCLLNGGQSRYIGLCGSKGYSTVQRETFTKGKVDEFDESE